MRVRPEYEGGGDYVWTRNGWTKRGQRNRHHETPTSPQEYSNLPTTSTIVRQGERTLRITLGGLEPLVEDITERKK